MNTAFMGITTSPHHWSLQGRGSGLMAVLEVEREIRVYYPAEPRVIHI